MVYIKRLSMQGFKSFAKKTDIIFDKGTNVILGPNGSGKSNISDALCFALGRLSIKSMRAAKAKNLLFMGSKYIKPCHEAVVELTFDNSDRTFAVNREEVSFKRIVRRHGPSIYKINDEAKTRNEVIELLAQAEVDPYGFNMVMQGQIQSIVEMHSEDRRKVIEEVAGISVYEVKKERSLKELEKTEEKLKEISSVLREKTSYLRNLESDRIQALKFKELENSVKKFKLSILNKRMEEKNKELNLVLKQLRDYSGKKDEALSIAENLQNEITNLSDGMEQISKSIQKATGVEQESLHSQIADLRAEVEGLKVRKEGYENRRDEIKRRVEEVKKNIAELKVDMASLRESSPMMEKKASELKKKKEELVQIGEERKRLLSIKMELNSLRERARDKEMQIGRTFAESDSLLKQIEKDSVNLSYKDEKECLKEINSIRSGLGKLKDLLNNAAKAEVENIHSMSVSESAIERAEKTKSDVQNIDICPLCRSKMTEYHIKHVFDSMDDELRTAKKIIAQCGDELNKIRTERAAISEKVRYAEERISKGEIELIRHGNINERKARLKGLVDYEHLLKDESSAVERRRKEIEEKIYDLNKIEEDYDRKILEIEEISSRTEDNVDDTILLKEREIEALQNVVKRGGKDIENMNEEIGEITRNFEDRENQLEIKERQERELNEKFKKMFYEKNLIQVKISEKNAALSEAQSMSRHADEQVNFFKIGKAKLDAGCESLQIEMSEYSGVEIIQGSIDSLNERLTKVQVSLAQIGSINLKALEVYDEVKKGYERVQEKVSIIEKEKQDILAIISEIDGKKRREFMKTFRAINMLFTENFSKAYSKGIAYLELENREDVFAGGVNVVVRLAKGKFFDASSLSGGEKTFVALSLLFAIQEYKPYHFYIFDEIDTALDKRNSEKLAVWLKQYMKSGQYIVISHNDAIILGADLLYGVSMQDAVSKVLKLPLGGEVKD